ncbi:glycosyltransferase family 4 protein [Luteibacter sp. 329MFSha]|uniref:glycosyltransferase family 4 protein n=1 Tax=Luteibacter sp. 329MFSha TaxID=1798239 RepID=UPI0008D8A201|nr:glycosyltransferase family 4 protein [Luteibacter sp. 329MFSha]SEW01824.1 Glycosyltransferase involved in cell wall bisynthesis [Luteibacter sp. 329MFSha]
MSAHAPMTNRTAPAARTLAVLLTSTSYPTDEGDWRGVFIRHMVGALAARDDIALSVWAPPGPLPPDAADATTPTETRMLATLMAEGGIAHLLRRRRFRGVLAAVRLIAGLRRAFSASRPDVYHINWLQCAMPLPTNGVPALVTVLGNDMRLLELPGVTGWIRRALRGRRVAICPNADWMVTPLERIFGDMATIKTVPFGIDPRWFDIDRNPQDTSHWLVVSRLTEKKLGPLFAWGERHFRGNARRMLHIIGPLQEGVTLPDWVQYHGPASPDRLRDHWFPVATGLISLSEHDEGRPQVMLEAMASGLPIIASRLPAHEDLITHGSDGMIVEGPDSFGAALGSLEDEDENRRMGAASRVSARERFGTWADCAARYSALYGRLVQETKGV